MGIYIKGMEMPTSCFYCPFRRKINPDDIQCLVTRDVFEETFAGTIEMRNRGLCPLIEIPPHGDLIDKDATMNEILEERGLDTACWFAGIVNDMPTVIPADKDGEENG